jgi:2-keto-4-pentenoate hydratase/2-oxohepta-3-ene-1,7-dioic acid hydratase in catechol pathway
VKLVTFTQAGTGQGRTRIGVVEGDEVVDLAAAAPDLPREMEAFLAAGASALDRARRASSGGPRIPLAQLKLEAPVLRPRKFLAIGLNYADHIAETGRPAPEFPVFFNKQVSCVNGPYDPIWMPKVSDKLDYEGELAFVIGRRCRHVPKARAHEVIAGYLICNDVSVRDWQMRSPTMTLGKSFDTHGPLGPWLVTPDEVGDPHGLDLETTIDGQRRQKSSTKNLVFDCYAQVETLSTAFTLEPGDVISTGTCGGVGVAMDPRGYMKVGQRVRVTISGLGHIENEVIDEPADTQRV